MKTIFSQILTGAIVIALATTSVFAEDDSPTEPAEVTTQPTEIDPRWELQLDFAKIRQQWTVIEEVLESEDYFRIRVEDVSGWSCGLQAAHCVMVLRMIAHQMEEGLEDPDLNVDEKKKPMANLILQRGIMPRGVAKAPDMVMPLSTDREHWLKTMKKTVAAWDRIEARADELPELPARFEHPYFGYLNSTEWVRFSGIHTAHHLKILADILKAAGDSADGFGKALTTSPVASSE